MIKPAVSVCSIRSHCNGSHRQQSLAVNARLSIALQFSPVSLSLRKGPKVTERAEESFCYTSWFADGVWFVDRTSVHPFDQFLNSGCKIRYLQIWDFLHSYFLNDHVFNCCLAGDRTQARCYSSCWCFRLNSSSAFSTLCTPSWERGTCCPPLLARLNERPPASQGDGWRVCVMVWQVYVSMYTRTHKTHTLLSMAVRRVWSQASGRVSIVILLALHSTLNQLKITTLNLRWLSRLRGISS